LFNTLWTPRFGILGAGWSILLAECLQAGILLVQYPTKSNVITTSPTPPAGADAVAMND
jgi:hypothetical protein